MRYPDATELVAGDTMPGTMKESASVMQESFRWGRAGLVESSLR